jgi:hypothetical protein
MGDGLLVRVRRRSGGSEPRHRLSFTVHVYRLAPDLPATGSVAPARHWRDKASPPCASMPGNSVFLAMAKWLCRAFRAAEGTFR